MKGLIFWSLYEATAFYSSPKFVEDYERRYAAWPFEVSKEVAKESETHAPYSELKFRKF